MSNRMISVVAPAGAIAALAAGVLTSTERAHAVVTLFEPGHTVVLIADSAAPTDPTQVILGLNPAGGGFTGIESITVSEATGLIYVQVITPYASALSPTTGIFEIVPATGVTAPLSFATGFGTCERGSDIDIDPVTGLLVAQDDNGIFAFGPAINTVMIPGGLIGLWSPAEPGVANTFGMDFSPGIGLLPPAGDIVYVADVGGGFNGAPLGGPNTFLFPKPFGPGDDMYIQADGDIVFVGEIGVPISSIDPYTFIPTPAAIPTIDAMFIADGLSPTCGSRATHCDDSGEGFITLSCSPGGHGIYRLNSTLTAATLLLTVTFPDEGIQDLTVGPSSSGSGQSLFVTVENNLTGGHQVYEITNICKSLVPKWSQLPHGFGMGGLPDLFGSSPIGGGGGPATDIWSIDVPGGPDSLLSTVPFGTIGGLATVPGGLIGVAGPGAGPLIHEISFAGAITSTRPTTAPTVLSFAGACTAPLPASAFGFTPGNVYATGHAPGAGAMTDSLVDLGPAGAGPDALIAFLSIIGVQGLAFDQVSGILYGVTAPFVFGTPHLVTLDAFGGVFDLGPILIGGGPVFAPIGGLAWSGGFLYAGAGGGIGDVIGMPAGAPFAAFIDHTVFGASLAGLTHGALGMGFNVTSDLNWPLLSQSPPGDPGPGPNLVVADDFISDGRPIVCVRWWGSYIDPLFEPGGPGFAQAPDAPEADAPRTSVETNAMRPIPGYEAVASKRPHVPAVDRNLETESAAETQQGPIGLGSEIDGWLLSFHTDLPADMNPLGFSRPLDLLGLYFAPADAVTIIPTDIIGWDGHRVYEYYAELSDACLLHAFPDPRPGASPPDPAHNDEFCETAGFIYWLDIQAVVGHTVVEVTCPTCTCDFDGDGDCDNADLSVLAACFGGPPGPGCPDLNCDGIINLADISIWSCLAGGGTDCCPEKICNEQPTQNFTFDHFWGWHTSPDAFNDNSVVGQVVIVGPSGDYWQYINWFPVSGEVCNLPVVDQAFELLTPSCPWDFNGDGFVGFFDLTQVLINWGACPPSPADCPWDFNCDDVVGFFDLTQILLNWGPCP